MKAIIFSFLPDSRPMAVSRGTSRAKVLLLSLGCVCAAAPVTAQDLVDAASEDRSSKTREMPLADFFCPPASSDKAVGEGPPSDPLLQDPQSGRLTCSPPTPVLPTRPAAPDLFGMTALPVENAPSMEKWERARVDTLADHDGPWTELRQQANAVTAGHPLQMVNMWVNWHLRYQEDQTDTWSDALTTLQREFGDCEDFAIAKMVLLAELGISSDDMFLVLVRDRSRASHAVLGVRSGEVFYILDNRTDRLRPATDVTEYTPIVSYSGDFEWVYGRSALQLSGSR